MAYSQPSSGVRGRMKCPVCLEQFDTRSHEPRILPCQHTVCDECLTEICRNKTTIQCPVDRCSHKVPGNGSFPVNLALRDVAEELQKQLLCEEHENQEGGVICINCLVPLCFNCLTNEQHSLHHKETLPNAKPALRDKLCEKRTDDIKIKLKSCKDTLKELTEAENDITRTYKNITDILTKWKEEEHTKIMTIKEHAEVQIAELEKLEEGLIRASFDEYNVPTLLQQLKEQGPTRNMQVSPPHSKYDVISAICSLKEHISEQCQRANKPGGEGKSESMAKPKVSRGSTGANVHRGKVSLYSSPNEPVFAFLRESVSESEFVVRESESTRKVPGRKVPRERLFPESEFQPVSTK